MADIKINEIYPTLIVQDSFLDDAEFFLNQKFKEKLDKTSKKIGVKVYPLTVISIDVLEMFPNGFDLKKFISDYISYKKNQEIPINAIRDYIVVSEYSNRLYINQGTLKKIEKKLIDDKKMLFSKIEK